MRTILLCAALLFVPACASKPIPLEPATLCASVPQGCAEASSRQKRMASYGIGADKTVMQMVQSPMLIGGKPADAAEWPASVYAKAGSSACSATLVGERVLFMASHCMPNGGTVNFTAHANAYKARCAHHPEYRNGKGNETADWALCLVDRPVTGVPFEVLGTAVPVALNQELLLSGYGCIKPGGGGGNDGIFRIGSASVKGLPGSKSYDIVTKGGAALCFGDSGGAAYRIQGKERHIVGVNSRGDISTMSYLPSVALSSFTSWARAWAQDANNVRICGLHDDAIGCRNGQPPAPQPDGKFEVSSKAACVRGVIAPSHLDRKGEIVDNLRRTLDQY